MKQDEIFLRIITPYMEVYEVSKDGSIRKKGNEFSEQWKLQGIEHVKKSWFIPFSKLTKELIKELPLLYKNGNPQFTVRDLDYGTTRVWGNTVYHGIRRIEFIN
jgi:hypothetical protein